MHFIGEYGTVQYWLSSVLVLVPVLEPLHRTTAAGYRKSRECREIFPCEGIILGTSKDSMPPAQYGTAGRYWYGPLDHAFSIALTGRILTLQYCGSNQSNPSFVG